MTVEKIATWIPVSDENIVDFELGTRHDQFEAQVRIMRGQWASDHAWRSLPIWVRAFRTVRAWVRRLERMAQGAFG